MGWHSIMSGCWSCIVRDAIMSAIDFSIITEEAKGSHGERRIHIIFDGKALPYASDEGWRPAEIQVEGKPGK